MDNSEQEEIGPARIEDFLSIAALDRQAWEQNEAGEYIPDGEHVWRVWVEHALVQVARCKGEVVGAALAFPCVSGPWCLHKLFLHASQRSRGLGKRLLAALLDELDRREVATFLTVSPQNAAAIRAYEKLGFLVQEKVPGYYRAQEDRLIMMRERKVSS